MDATGWTAFSMAVFSLEYIFQLLAAELLAAWSLRRQARFPLRATAACLLSVALYALLQRFSPSLSLGPVFDTLLAGWKYLFVFAFTVLCLRMCYAENIWSVLFCCTAAQATQHLAHRVRDLFTFGLSQGFQLPIFLAVTALVFPVVFTAVYFLFFRKLRNRQFPNINNRNMIFAASACVILCLFIAVHDYAISGTEGRVAFDLAMILVCFFILCYQFGFLDHSWQQAEYEALQQAFQSARKQYEMTRENIEIINIKCHDIRKQIRYLGREANVDESALKEITDAVRIYDATIRTGSPVLDVILTDRSIYCDRNRIHLGCMVDGACLSFIHSMDMASLFGNLIDNAIEAVMQLENPEKAIINLTVHSVGGMALIHCENYCRPGVTFEDGLPVTTKQDKYVHGFGVKSIRFVAEKYGGTVTLSQEDDVFSVNISIPIPVPISRSENA